MGSATDIAKQWMKAYEAGDLDTVDGLTADDAVFSGPVPEPLGKQELMALYRALGAAMPDWTFHARDFHEDGDSVTFTVAVTATFTQPFEAPFLGLDHVEPTGKAAQNPDEPVTVTVKDAKITKIEVEPVPGAGVPGVLQRVGVDLPQ